MKALFQTVKSLLKLEILIFAEAVCLIKVVLLDVRNTNWDASLSIGSEIKISTRTLGWNTLTRKSYQIVMYKINLLRITVAQCESV